MTEINIFSQYSFFKTPVLPSIRREYLHGVVTSIGHESEGSHEYSFNGLQRGNKAFAVFQLTLNGLGAIKKESNITYLPPGTFLLVKIPDDHIYYLPDESENWEFIYICFAGEEFIRLVDIILNLHGNTFSIKDYPMIIKYCNEIFSHVTINTEFDEFLLSRCIYSMLMEIISQKYQLAKSNAEVSNKYILFTKKYCKNNIENSFSIEDIALHLGINKSYLSRIFKSYQKINLQQYIENLRMERAIYYLINSKCTIKGIGLKCGYSDLNYFSRVFKKRFAQSPREYRNNNIKLYIV